MGKESGLQTTCTDYLKRKGIYAINMYGSGRTAKGAPDVIACICGKFVAFELKVGNNKQQPDQLIHEKRIKQSMGLHYVVYDFETFKNIVSEISGGYYD